MSSGTSVGPQEKGALWSHSEWLVWPEPQGISSSSIRWEDDPEHPAEFGLNSCL